MLDASHFTAAGYGRVPIASNSTAIGRARTAVSVQKVRTAGPEGPAREAILRAQGQPGAEQERAVLRQRRPGVSVVAGALRSARIARGSPAYHRHIPTRASSTGRPGTASRPSDPMHQARRVVASITTSAAPRRGTRASLHPTTDWPARLCVMSPRLGNTAGEYRSGTLPRRKHAPSGRREGSVRGKRPERPARARRCVGHTGSRRGNPGVEPSNSRLPCARTQPHHRDRSPPRAPATHPGERRRIRDPPNAAHKPFAMIVAQRRTFAKGPIPSRGPTQRGLWTTMHSGRVAGRVPHRATPVTSAGKSERPNAITTVTSAASSSPPPGTARCSRSAGSPASAGTGPASSPDRPPCAGSPPDRARPGT